MNHLTPGPTVKLLVAVLAASALTAASTPPNVAPQERSWAQYRILVDRNMFRSDRRRRFVPTSLPSAPVYDSDGGNPVPFIQERELKRLPTVSEVAAKKMKERETGQN